MTDLTKITTPFGLLDAETQKALQEHCGPFEFYDYRGLWSDIGSGEWFPSLAYRVKPQPPKPREWWANIYPGVGFMHATKAEADKNSSGMGRLECIKVVEVLE